MLVSFSAKSESNWLLKEMVEGNLQLCLTDEIVFEYQEIIERFMGSSFAEDSIAFLLSIPTTIYIRLYYNWHLINSDVDDNKFSDCYIASNAEYLITHDNAFRSLKNIKFPSINVVSLSEFKALYKNIKR